MKVISFFTLVNLMNIKLLLLTCSFLIFSCATMNQNDFNVMWQGKNLNDLIFKYGVPANSVLLEDGRSVAEYVDELILNGTSYKCTITVYANQNSQISKIEFRGGCRGTMRRWENTTY